MTIDLGYDLVTPRNSLSFPDVENMADPTAEPRIFEHLHEHVPNRRDTCLLTPDRYRGRWMLCFMQCHFASAHTLLEPNAIKHRNFQSRRNARKLRVYLFVAQSVPNRPIGCRQMELMRGAI